MRLFEKVWVGGGIAMQTKNSFLASLGAAFEVFFAFISQLLLNRI